MKLLPDDIVKRLPPLYSQEEQGDNAIAVVKFFTPWTGWTWYASEHDPDKRLCFRVVVGQEREFGYFSIDELKEIRGPGGLTIERNLHWKPRPRIHSGLCFESRRVHAGGQDRGARIAAHHQSLEPHFASDQLMLDEIERIAT